MRILAAHDAEGNIHQVVVSPAGAPPATVTTESGLLVTEVEPPEGISGRDLAKVLQHLQDFRVEVKEGKLTRTKSKK
jgi:hypothetical protein